MVGHGGTRIHKDGDEVARDAQKVLGSKISMNCSPDALSGAFAAELNANLGSLVLELTGWRDTMNTELASMPNVEVWLDDVPPDTWKHIPTILTNCTNVTCVKISYMDSCIVMGKMNQ